MKVDYLTISLLPGISGYSLDYCQEKLMKCMFMEDFADKWERVGSNRNYTDIYRYCNISLKIPSFQRFGKQGICLEFSGQGLDYYQAYLDLYHNTTLQMVCRRFRLLYKFGLKSQCSRIDIAFDDKCFGEDKPLLDLDIIEETLKDRAFVSQFRRSDPADESGKLVSMFKIEPKKIDDELPFRMITSMNLSSGAIGKTIYLGKRSSAAFVRFYDKKAEQEVKKAELPAGLTHWTRFEIEFKKKNAGAMFSAFCDSKSEKDFVAVCSRKSYDLIRFVDKDHSRNYNCTVCGWWLAFLGAMADKSITINKLSVNAYIKFLKYAYRSLAAGMYAITQCSDDVLAHILEKGAEKESKTKNSIIKDFKAFQGLSPGDKKAELEKAYHEMTGEEYWRLFTGDETDKDFARRMWDEHLEVFNINVGVGDEDL